MNIRKCTALFPSILLLLTLWSIQCAKENNVSPSEEALMIDYSHRGCDISPVGIQYHLMSDSAEVEISIDGLEVTVTHKNAILNCCLDSILVEFTQQGNLLRLTEMEETPMPCFCLCPHFVEVTIAVPRPGTYVIEIWTVRKLVWREEIFVPGR